MISCCTILSSICGKIHTQIVVKSCQDVSCSVYWSWIWYPLGCIHWKSLNLMYSCIKSAQCVFPMKNSTGSAPLSPVLGCHPQHTVHLRQRNRNSTLIMQGCSRVTPLIQERAWCNISKSYWRNEIKLPSSVHDSDLRNRNPANIHTPPNNCVKAITEPRMFVTRYAVLGIWGDRESSGQQSLYPISTMCIPDEKLNRNCPP